MVRLLSVWALLVVALLSLFHGARTYNSRALALGSCVGILATLLALCTP